ncbi:MAG: YihY/virulence factor BrkB family protein [Erysipelotrichaceae bacterium]
MLSWLKKLGCGYNKTYDLFLEYHIDAYASKIAFFVIASAIPLAMLGVIAFGLLEPFNIIEINEAITRFLPATIHKYAFRFVEDIFSISNIQVASFTSIILLWSSSQGIRSIGDGLKTIYRYDGAYSWIKGIVYAIIGTIIFIFSIMASLVVLVFAAPLQSFFTYFFSGKASFILTLINMRNIIFFLYLTLLFALAYKYLAKNNIRFVDHLFGATIASASWVLFSYLFFIYIKYFSNYSYIYGSLGAIMLFLLWIYMCMKILLIGALINKLKFKDSN